MTAASAVAAAPAGRRGALLAILVGGFTAGALDFTQATTLFGFQVWRGVAAALLGERVLHEGAPIYALGIFLHFFIACSVTAIYYAASRRLRFLTEHPLVCGLVYGALVENVMNLIVLPLSALHARGPYELQDLLLGLGVHMVVIGLPVSFSVRRFGKI